MHWKALRDAIVCSTYTYILSVQCFFYILIDYITLISWEQCNILTENWVHNICICSFAAVTWCNMCWARAFIDSFCRQNWMSFLKASMEKICEGGKHATMVVVLWCCRLVAVVLDFATVLHVDIRGGLEKNSEQMVWTKWTLAACRLFDATLAFLPPSPRACNFHHGVPWSFRFQGF